MRSHFKTIFWDRMLSKQQSIFNGLSQVIVSFTIVRFTHTFQDFFIDSLSFFTRKIFLRRMLSFLHSEVTRHTSHYFSTLNYSGTFKSVAMQDPRWLFFSFVLKPDKLEGRLIPKKPPKNPKTQVPRNTSNNFSQVFTRVLSSLLQCKIQANAKFPLTFYF